MLFGRVGFLTCSPVFLIKIFTVKRRKIGLNSFINLVKEKISDSVKRMGYEIYHAEYVNELGHNYLRIMIVKQDVNEKITISDCEIVSKGINNLIDEVNVDNNKFFLEVSSPGINRKLYTMDHIKQAVGRVVRVKLHKALNDCKIYIGTLEEVDNSQIILNVKDDKVEVGIDNIKNMNLEEVS